MAIMLLNVKRMMNVGLTDPSFSYKTVFISDVNFPGRKFVSPLPAVYFEQLRLFLRAEESKIEQGKIASSLFPSLCSHFLFIFLFLFSSNSPSLNPVFSPSSYHFSVPSSLHICFKQKVAKDSTVYV
jgi:hypothetical protein